MIIGNINIDITAHFKYVLNYCPILQSTFLSLITEPTRMTNYYSRITIDHVFTNDNNSVLTPVVIFLTLSIITSITKQFILAQRV